MYFELDKNRNNPDMIKDINQTLSKLYGNSIQLEEIGSKILVVISASEHKRYQSRNAGRRYHDETFQRKKEQFEELYYSKKDREFIQKKMKISKTTYYRYLSEIKGNK